MSKIVKWLYSNEAIFLGYDSKEPAPNRNQNRYYITPKEWDKIQEVRKQTRGYVKTAQKTDKDGNIISITEKLQSEPIQVPDNHEIIRTSTNKTTGQQWVITAPKKETIEENTINFEKIIKKHIKPVDKDIKKVKSKYLFDRLVYTDVHIGMETNENGFSLYGGKWDEKEIRKRLKAIITHTIANKKSNVLVIDDLGDFMDGWDGETVRKGHRLPQNMDNEKAFDLGVYFKVYLIDVLINHYDKIVCNNVCNDNHAGSFAYVVNSSVKQILEQKYKNVKVNNIRKFIDHYFIGKYCFILTHGKDGKNLKFGFKPFLDPKQIEKIKNYIDHHNILAKSEFIEFSKGDSHQKVFDESSSDTFDYYNYGALSPSSEWVQTNFKKGKSFFEFFNFDNKGNKKHHPYKFKWNVNRKETRNNIFV